MARRGLFDRYFNGRPDQREFTEKDLPQNRRQLFFLVLRTRLGELCRLNLLYALSCLPMIVWSVMNLVAAAAELGRADFASFVFYEIMPIYLLGLVPLLALAGPFNLAVHYVLRNWARDEHADLWVDYRDALKANWKQGLALGVANGLIYVLAGLCGRFYLQLAQGEKGFFLPLAVLVAALIFWNLCGMLLPVMFITYDQKFWPTVRNAVRIAFAELLWALGIKLACFAPVLLALLMMVVLPAYANWVFSILLGLYAVIVVAIQKLLTASFANYACEKHLNTRIQGAKVGIGVHCSEK